MSKRTRSWIATAACVAALIMVTHQKVAATNYTYATDIPVGWCAGNDSGTYYLCHGYDSLLGYHMVYWTAFFGENNCGSRWTSAIDVYDPASAHPIDCWPFSRRGYHVNQWAPGDTGNHLAVQQDGNVVLYDGSGNAVWATNTAGYNGAYLALQDDKNVVVYYGSTPLWSLFG